MQEILGRERRRRWSDEEKARMVAESYQPGVSVSWVARRHGLSPSQLFAWRKAAKQIHGAGEPISNLIPVEVAIAGGAVAPSNSEDAAASDYVEITFPNERHLFVPAALDRRLLDELIAAVAAS